MRGIGTEMLKELGYTVKTAVHGKEAIDVFKNNPDISFVILDLTMPRMDGVQCISELSKIDPQVKVIMSSGFSEQEVSLKFVGLITDSLGNQSGKLLYFRHSITQYRYVIRFLDKTG